MLQKVWPKKDNRTPNAPPKYTEAAKSYVRSFIEKLPAVPSHYNRKRTNRTYLPQELKNVTNLYRIYLKDCNETGQENVSETVFRSIFREYNISFHIPKKDKCITCINAENNKETMTDIDKESMNAHIEEKNATKPRFKIHQNLRTLNNETIVSSFDLQKVLNTPHGESMLLYYSRKYAVYNLTFYESGTQDVYCYTWGECDGKRGSNEIATCLLKYLDVMDRKGTKHLILYCDSCSGQNKNKIVLAAVNNFIKTATNLEVIQLNYLLPGHTYMPVDAVHAVIEREVKNLIVYAPSQWATYFESARKRPRPYKVHSLDHTDFLNLDDLAAKTFTSATLKKLKCKQVRIATFKKKNPNQMFVKYSMKQESVSHTVILCENISRKGKERKGKGQLKGKKDKQIKINEEASRAGGVLYDSKLKISSMKYRDLIRLCDTGAIPKKISRRIS
ncbi:unnamed protein product [Parnassius apollo]|uniref:(apollo) hypothetical protein n=1 Tax=Parnassius apollo TaxID=110799 RepID=A0A8S3X2X8_PARAO|nr:unnamed protein product [Parnassius apollo]